MEAKTDNALPLGIGRFGIRWIAFASCLLAILGVGLYAYSQQAAHGLIVTNMRTIGSGGASWGLYIVFDVFFIGVSFAGITVAAMIRLFGIKELKALARVAELVTICALLLGACVVLADLGRPLHGLLNLPRFARPMSPFFGTFTMVVGGYLFASLVYFYLSGRSDAAYCAARAGRYSFLYRLWASGYRGTVQEKERHHETSFWLSLFILPLLVTAHSTLGFIFGIQGGRPGWYSALQAPGFVVMAGVSGIGVVIVAAAAVRKFLHLEDVIRPEAFRWLGTFLWILIVVYLYFMIAEELTVSYASSSRDREVSHAMVFGAYRHLFMTAVACLVVPLVILFVQFATRRTSIAWTVAAGLILQVAAILKRFLLVIPSQTHGTLLPYNEGHYTPSWVEVCIIAGLFAFGTFLYALFVKVFPIVPVAHQAPDAATPPSVVETPRRRALRIAFTAMALVGGVTFAVVGFAASARVGTRSYLDPVVPYAPVLFITGVMLTFFSSAVYETLPPMKKLPATAPAVERAAPASASSPAA